MGNHTFYLSDRKAVKICKAFFPFKKCWFFLLCCLLNVEWWFPILSLFYTSCEGDTNSLCLGLPFQGCLCGRYLKKRERVSLLVPGSGGLASTEDIESSGAKREHPYWPLKMISVPEAQISFSVLWTTARSFVVWPSLWCPLGTRAQGI